MINPNRQFADALRSVLTDCGVTAAQIDQAIAGELKEVQIAQTLAAAVAAIGQGAAMKASLLLRAAAIGAVYDPTTGIWDLGPTGIDRELRLSATEELGAICRFGGRPGFDAAKAITNLLRLIKAAGRM